MRHHYVPTFYQKQWADSQGKLFIYQRPIPEKLIVEHKGPRAKGWTEDLYAVDVADPELAQFLEQQFLQRVDNLAAEAIQQLTEHGPEKLDRRRRSAWTTYVINTLMRHPDAFSELREHIENIWEVTDEEVERDYAKMRQPHMPPTFRDFARHLRRETDAKLKLQLYLGVFDNEGLTKRLFKMSWTVYDSSSSRFPLLTSDQPLVRDIRRDRMCFLMPISPNRLFVATDSEEFGRATLNRKADDLVARVNKHVTRYARNFVFAPDRSQDDFVAKHMAASKIETAFFPSLRGRAVGR